MLAATSNLLMKCYHGDLRKLLMGANASAKPPGTFFLREVRTTSAELQPFADTAALESASKLDLAAQES